MTVRKFNRPKHGHVCRRQDWSVAGMLILTTVVLACGLVVTVFSDLPSLRLFGWLSAFSMVAALVADLFILRPTSMFLINLSEKLRGTRGHAKPAE